MARLLMFFVFVLSACSQSTQPITLDNNLNWIDLGHSLDTSTLYWPNNVKGFEHYTEAESETALGYYSSFSFCAPEHGGTHIDAPIHFAKNKFTVDRIPLSRLTGFP